MSNEAKDPKSASDDIATTEHGDAEGGKRKKRKDGGFTFTDSGCRTENRLGILLVLIGVFLWLWMGPVMASLFYFCGVPLLAWGIPKQAFEARTIKRPGYPWKAGIALLWLGVMMVIDLSFRNQVGGPLRVQEIGVMLTAAAVWILAWWPVALWGTRQGSGAVDGVAHGA